MKSIGQNKLENSTVLDAVHDISENSSTDTEQETELHKAGQPLKSPGFEFREKQAPKKKSKRRKVSTSSSDLYKNENSEFSSASSINEKTEEAGTGWN
jgi:hypothetical protein